MKKLYLLILFSAVFILSFSSCTQDSSIIIGNGAQSGIEKETENIQNSSVFEGSSPITFGVFRSDGITFGVPEGFVLNSYTASNASFINYKNNIAFVYDKRKTALSENDLTEKAINKLYGGYLPGSVKLIRKASIGPAQGVYFEYGPEKDISKSNNNSTPGLGDNFMIYQSSVLLDGHLYSFIFYSDNEYKGKIGEYMEILIKSVKFA